MCNENDNDQFEGNCAVDIDNRLSIYNYVQAFIIYFIFFFELTFFKWPSRVPMKTTVKSPVDVAATAVNNVGKVSTGTAVIGSCPPSGVFTSRPQKSSAIVCNF